MKKKQLLEDYQRIEKAIGYIEKNVHRQPRLEEIAKEIGLSEYHFQRLFKRWAGISPKRFLQVLTVEYAKKVMKRKKNLLDTAWDSGLSGGGRLHDLFVTVEGMTPGSYKNQGKSMEISYGFHPSPVGECLVAVTDKGICHLSFLNNGNTMKVLSELKRKWKYAKFNENSSLTSNWMDSIFNKNGSKKEIKLYLKGTNFQIKVWQALLQIPKGDLTNYQEIAKSIHKPKAVRAVGTAVGQNPIAYLIQSPL